MTTYSADPLTGMPTSPAFVSRLLGLDPTTATHVPPRTRALTKPSGAQQIAE